jgi:hypothetical protein
MYLYDRHVDEVADVGNCDVHVRLQEKEDASQWPGQRSEHEAAYVFQQLA